MPNSIAHPPRVFGPQYQAPSPSSEPSDISDPYPELTPRPTTLNDGNRFSFSVHAHFLKRAIAGLSDPDLNPNGLGLMQVCDCGFELTAFQNSESNAIVFGFLSLKASGLINFVCVDDTVETISLKNLNTYLETKASDSDVVKVYSVDGSNSVCFSFRKRFCGIPRRCFLEIPFGKFVKGQFIKFPIFSYGFEMPIQTNKLEDVLNRILAQIPGLRPHTISIHIGTKVGMKAGDCELQLLDESMIVWVNLFPYWESLRKMLSLSNECLLWIGSVPREMVVLRFDLGSQVGDFIYLKLASEFFMNKDLPTIGTFWPLHSK